MTVYHLSTRINSNVSAKSLLYDLCIYHVNNRKNKTTLVDVKQQLFKDNYETQSHLTENINEPLSIICIMEITIYHKTMLHIYRVNSVPFTKMYTLTEFASGKAFSPVKRENPCYFVSKATMKPESEVIETIHIKITRQERPFISQEYPIGTSQDPFAKNKVEEDIQNRFNHLSYPTQASASLCGPAVFFYCLQRDRPDVYAQAARELWRYGKTKIGELDIAPGEGCRHPAGYFYGDISGVDWMTLAGLRDSENTVFRFDALDSPVAGITLWQTLIEWFEKAGYEKVFSNVGMTQAGIQGVRDLNRYVQQGYKVVTLINDGLLVGSNNITTLPTHWIVWDDIVTQDSNGYIKLTLFSWGKSINWIKPKTDLSFFINRFFGGVVFKPLR